MVRIPGWTDPGATLAVNGEPFPEALVPGSFVRVQREWPPGDRVQVNLPMPVWQIESHPYVEENSGRVAVMRGPLLYCFEQVDNPGVSLRDIELPDDVSFEADYRPDLLGGVVALSGAAWEMSPGESWSDALYGPARSIRAATRKPVSITAIPYHAWANRAPGQMWVWLRHGA